VDGPRQQLPADIDISQGDSLRTRRRNYVVVQRSTFYWGAGGASEPPTRPRFAVQPVPSLRSLWMRSIRHTCESDQRPGEINQSRQAVPNGRVEILFGEGPVDADSPGCLLWPCTPSESVAVDLLSPLKARRLSPISRRFP
jgi:hypothetical protein